MLIFLDDVPCSSVECMFFAAISEPQAWPGSRMPVAWDVLLVRSANFRINIGMCYSTSDAAFGACSADMVWLFQCCSGELLHGGKQQVGDASGSCLRVPYGQSTWSEGDRVGVYIEFVVATTCVPACTCSVYFTKNGVPMSLDTAFRGIQLTAETQLCPIVELRDLGDSVQLVPKHPIAEASDELDQLATDIREFERLSQP